MLAFEYYITVDKRVKKREMNPDKHVDIIVK